MAAAARMAALGLAVVWPPPTAHRAGPRAEAARLVRPGGQQRRRPAIGEARAADRDQRRTGSPRRAEGRSRTAVAWPPGSDRRSRRRRERSLRRLSPQPDCPIAPGARHQSHRLGRRRRPDRRSQPRGRLTAAHRAAGGTPGRSGKTGSAWRPCVFTPSITGTCSLR